MAKINCHSCLICGSNQEEKLSYFRFPKKEVTRQLWKSHFQIPNTFDVSSSFLCSKHFIFENGKKKGFNDNVSIFLPDKYNDHNACVLCGVNRGDLLSYHRFPLDEVEKSKWLIACNIPLDQPVPKNSRLCSIHFKDTDFANLMKKGGRRRVKRGVVPSIFYTMGMRAKRQLSRDIADEFCIICGWVEKSVTCFKFPIDVAMAKKWIEFCKTYVSKFTKCPVLCQIHFKQSDFIEENGQPRFLLKKDAIPSLFPSSLPGPATGGSLLPNDVLPSSTSSMMSQSSSANIVNGVNLDSCKEVEVLSPSACFVDDSVGNHGDGNVSEEDVIIVNDDDGFSDSMNAESFSPNPCDSSTNNSKKLNLKRPRYIGDVKPQDYNTREKAKFVVDLAKRNVLHYRAMITKLRRQNNRLKKQLLAAIETIEDFSKRDAFIDDDC